MDVMDECGRWINVVDGCIDVVKVMAGCGDTGICNGLMW